MMITTKAVEGLNKDAELVELPMLLALGHFLYYECGWIIVAMTGKKYCVQILSENAVFLVQDPASKDLIRLNKTAKTVEMKSVSVNQSMNFKLANLMCSTGKNGVQHRTQLLLMILILQTGSGPSL